jgi:hypothetical protein
MDGFLEEQLKRIQELTRRVARLENRSAELSQEIERDRRNVPHGPLDEVRDLRTYSGSDSRVRATSDDARPRRRRTARRNPR